MAHDADETAGHNDRGAMAPIQSAMTGGGMQVSLPLTSIIIVRQASTTAIS
jgi:hypothetical protein